MLLKMGVDISRLEKPIRRKLRDIENQFLKYNQEPVISSTYEGNHSPGSLHYANLAIDFRSNRLYTSDKASLIINLKQILGNDYDIISESDHIHIEYDPK